MVNLILTATKQMPKNKRNTEVFMFTMAVFRIGSNTNGQLVPGIYIIRLLQ